MTRTHVLRSLVVGAAAILLTGVLSTAAPVSAAPDPGSRVAADSAGLSLDGEPWWPTGFNAYQLATDWSVNAGCGAMVDLDSFFSALPAHSLTRFNAFQALASPGNSTSDPWTPSSPPRKLTINC